MINASFFVSNFHSQGCVRRGHFFLNGQLVDYESISAETDIKWTEKESLTPPLSVGVVKNKNHNLK